MTSLGLWLLAGLLVVFGLDPVTHVVLRALDWIMVGLLLRVAWDRRPSRYRP